MSDPEQYIRGPAIRPSRIASRMAMSRLSSAPTLRAVVTPRSSQMRAFRAPRSVNSAVVSCQAGRRRSWSTATTWKCMSMSPAAGCPGRGGAVVAASNGTSSARPTAATRPAWTTTAPFSIGARSVPSQTRSARNTVRGAEDTYLMCRARGPSDMAGILRLLPTACPPGGADASSCLLGPRLPRPRVYPLVRRAGPPASRSMPGAVGRSRVAGRVASRSLPTPGERGLPHTQAGRPGVVASAVTPASTWR